MITVLFSLVILSILFATAQQNYLANAYSLHTTLIKLKKMSETHSAPAILEILKSQKTSTLVYEIDTEDIAFSLEGVSGLLDLNTSSKDQLVAVLRALELADAESVFEEVRAWRRQGGRFLRVEDFEKFANLTIEQKSVLSQISTVHSGRTNVDPTFSSPQLLSLLGIVNEPISNNLDSNYRLSISRNGVPPYNIVIMNGSSHLNHRVLAN